MRSSTLRKTPFLPSGAAQDESKQAVRHQTSSSGTKSLHGAANAKTDKPKRRQKLVRSGGVPPNPKFLAFVRTLPCILVDHFNHRCGGGPIEAAHIGLGPGMGQKAPDETAVPMCPVAHRTGRWAFHSMPRSFFQHWSLDRELLILRYQHMAREAGLRW